MTDLSNARRAFVEATAIYEKALNEYDKEEIGTEIKTDLHETLLIHTEYMDKARREYHTLRGIEAGGAKS